MKIRHLASLLPLILGAAVIHAQDMGQPAADASAPAAPAAAPAKPKAPKTALEKDMDKINRAVRTLKKQINDPSKNDSSLALVATIHDAAVAASNETPAWTADQPQADQAQFVTDFKTKIKSFVGDIDKLSAALTAGDNPGAAKLLAALGQDEKAGHKKFKKPEDNN